MKHLKVTAAWLGLGAAVSAAPPVEATRTEAVATKWFWSTPQLGASTV